MPRMRTDIESEQLSEVMDRVKGWPQTMRIALVKSVLDTFDVPQVVLVPRGRPVEEMIGLGAGSSPAPDDERVKSWIDERRMEKYG